MKPRHLVLLAMLLATGACASRSDDTAAYSNSTLKVADVALANGAPAMAMQVAQQVLAKDPTNVEALVRRGSAEAALDQNAQATTTFNQILSLSPGNVAAQMGLARLQLRTNPKAAEAAFAAIAQKNGNDWAAFANLGVARDLMGRHAEAQQAYRQALAIEPSGTGTQVNLGLSLALSGESAAALAILKPIAERDDTSIRVRQDLAAALALAGDTGRATEMLQRDMPKQEAEQTVIGYQALKVQ